MLDGRRVLGPANVGVGSIENMGCIKVVLALALVEKHSPIQYNIRGYSRKLRLEVQLLDDQPA
jgi:hypothetical protein